MRKNLFVFGLLAGIALGVTSVIAATTPFNDVPADHWAIDAVQWAESNKIVRGYEQDGTFRGNNYNTRYELVQVLLNYDQMRQDDMRAMSEKMEAMQQELDEMKKMLDPDYFPVVDQDDQLIGGQVYQVCKSEVDGSRVYFNTAPFPDFEDKYYDSTGMLIEEVGVKDCLFTTKEFFESKTS